MMWFVEHCLPALLTFGLCQVAYRQGRAYERMLIEPLKVWLIRKNVLEQTEDKTLEQIKRMRIEADNVYSQMISRAK